MQSIYASPNGRPSTMPYLLDSGAITRPDPNPRHDPAYATQQPPDPTQLNQAFSLKRKSDAIAESTHANTDLATHTPKRRRSVSGDGYLFVKLIELKIIELKGWFAQHIANATEQVLKEGTTHASFQTLSNLVEHETTRFVARCKRNEETIAQCRISTLEQKIDVLKVVFNKMLGALVYMAYSNLDRIKFHYVDSTQFAFLLARSPIDIKVSYQNCDDGREWPLMEIPLVLDTHVTHSTPFVLSHNVSLQPISSPNTQAIENAAISMDYYLPPNPDTQPINRRAPPVMYAITHGDHTQQVPLHAALQCYAVRDNSKAIMEVLHHNDPLIAMFGSLVASAYRAVVTQQDPVNTAAQLSRLDHLSRCVDDEVGQFSEQCTLGTLSHPQHPSYNLKHVSHIDQRSLVSFFNSLLDALLRCYKEQIPCTSFECGCTDRFRFFITHHCTGSITVSVENRGKGDWTDLMWVDLQQNPTPITTATEEAPSFAPDGSPSTCVIEASENSNTNSPVSFLGEPFEPSLEINLEEFPVFGEDSYF